MKIGVISDTHMSQPFDSLNRLMESVFADVSMVLHAGDLTSLDILEVFSGKKVISVRGNMDYYDVSQNLPDKRVIEVEGYRIGLTHGWGARNGVEDRIKEVFQNVQAIVYGHTHTPANHINDGILFFNPGAFPGTISAGQKRSVGLLTIDNGIKGTIISV
ncbi:MAG: metallophosphoesterase family protein [Deltaproteobacteria bacterium]|nr:metallophosphoesterase family protein [Deltaproteobacteria bacterium]